MTGGPNSLLSVKILLGLGIGVNISVRVIFTENSQ